MKKETVNPDQSTIDFLLRTNDIDSAASMFEFMVPAGAKVPVTFYHESFNETIYGLERIITFTVEAKAINIAPGETCFIPCGAVQSF